MKTRISLALLMIVALFATMRPAATRDTNRIQDPAPVNVVPQKEGGWDHPQDSTDPESKAPDSERSAIMAESGTGFSQTISTGELTYRYEIRPYNSKALHFAPEQSTSETIFGVGPMAKNGGSATTTAPGSYQLSANLYNQSP